MLARLSSSWSRRPGGWVVLFALFVVFEVYALFIKRSGETAYLPPADSEAASLEIAGQVALDQTFTMGAGGLDRITIFPLASGLTRGPVHVTLFGFGLDHPVAAETFPAQAFHSASWTWPLPRIDWSSGRSFVLRIALPEARPGEGLRFVIGEPRYAGGHLVVGGRPQWGDLKFATHAWRGRTIDAIRDRRRALPRPIRSDAALVALLVLFNWAVATVLVSMASDGSGGGSLSSGSRGSRPPTVPRPGGARSG